MTKYGTSTPLNGNFDASEADVFGMSSFSLNRRRKSGDSLARFTTKAVLLSPLLILSVWSLIVMFSGTRKLQQTTPSQGLRMPMRPHSKQTGRVIVRPNHKGVTSQFTSGEQFMNTQQSGQLIVQPSNLQEGEQQLQYMASSNTKGKKSSTGPRSHQRNIHKEGKMIPIYVPLGDTQQASMVPQTTVIQEGKMVPIYVPLGSTQQMQAAAIQQVALLNTQGASNRMNAQGANAMMNTQGANTMMNTQGANTMMNTQGANNMMNAQGANTMMDRQGTNAMMENQMQLGEEVSAELTSSQAADGQEIINTQSENIMMNENPMAASQLSAPHGLIATNQESTQIPDPLGSDYSVIMRPRPNPQGSTSSSSSTTTTVLYYDPSAATVDGQLYVPQVVYDADGNEVDLKALQALKNAEIYLEPPAATLDQEQMTSTENAPRQQMSRSDFESYAADPPVQDQYIIISTVAVMALLVGALSARRLRSRNFLSSCIENESLEDEVAYDVATTNGDYSTFGGHWKGDLEKFDV